MIPNHYLEIILGLFVGSVLGFGASAIIGAFRRSRAYCKGWDAAMAFNRRTRGDVE